MEDTRLLHLRSDDQLSTLKPTILPSNQPINGGSEPTPKRRKRFARVFEPRQPPTVLSNTQVEDATVEAKSARLEAELKEERRLRQDMFLELMIAQDAWKNLDIELARDKRRHEKEITAWEERLETTKEDHKREAEEQDHLKQDLFLQLMLAQDSLKKKDSDHSRELKGHAKVIEDWEELRATLERDHKRDADKLRLVRAENSGLRDQLEHSEAVNIVLQSDIEELRTVEIEAASKRNDEHRGLPPAYGSLDDENNFPPYSAHADAGTIEVAHLKRTIRQRYEATITATLRNSVGRSGPGLLPILCLGLEEACSSLQTLLDIAPSVPVSCARAPVDHTAELIELNIRRIRAGEALNLPDPLGQQMTALAASIRGEAPQSPNTLSSHFSSPRQILNRRSLIVSQGKVLIQTPNSAPYVADRIAKLILELLWRTVSACDLRPPAFTFDYCFPAGRASLTLRFSQLDAVLLTALQLAFSRESSLASLQYYLTQLERLRVLLKVHSFDYLFFGKAIEWLSDQIEKEREMAASVTVTYADSARGDDHDCDHGVESDAASSRWEGSESESESSSEDEGSESDDGL